MGKIVPAGNLEELHCRCVRVTVTANTNKHIEKSRGKPAVCVVYTLTLYVQVAVKREKPAGRGRVFFSYIFLTATLRKTFPQDKLQNKKLLVFFLFFFSWDGMYAKLLCFLSHPVCDLSFSLVKPPPFSFTSSTRAFDYVNMFLGSIFFFSFLPPPILLPGFFL